MNTASFTGFVRTLFYIILFYYVFRFLMRLVMPFLAKKAMDHAQESLRKQQERDTWDTVEEGKTYVKNTKPKKSTTQNDAGEYIDYEEIK